MSGDSLGQSKTVLYCVGSVFWVIVVLNDEVSPNRLDAVLCKLEDRMFPQTTEFILQL